MASNFLRLLLYFIWSIKCCQYGFVFGNGLSDNMTIANTYETVNTIPGAPVVSAYLQAAISSSSNPTVLIAGSGTKTIRVFRIVFVNAGSSTTNITIQDSTPTSFSGAFPLLPNGSVEGDGAGDPLYTTAAGEGFQLVNSASQLLTGTIWYTSS